MAGEDDELAIGQWLTYYHMRCDGCREEFTVSVAGKQGGIPTLILCPNRLCNRAYTFHTTAPEIGWIDATIIQKEGGGDGQR